VHLTVVKLHKQSTKEDTYRLTLIHLYAAKKPQSTSLHVRNAENARKRIDIEWYSSVLEIAYSICRNVKIKCENSGIEHQTINNRH
jgi:hypothetical protein